MARERLYRMTEIQRNMLVVALMDEYRKQKARGVPYPPIGRLAVRAEDAPRHKNRLPWDKERLYGAGCAQRPAQLAVLSREGRRRDGRCFAQGHVCKVQKGAREVGLAALRGLTT